MIHAGGVVTDSVDEHDGRVHPCRGRTRGLQWRIPVDVIVSEVLAIARHRAGYRVSSCHAFTVGETTSREATACPYPLTGASYAFHA